MEVQVLGHAASPPATRLGTSPRRRAVWRVFVSDRKVPVTREGLERLRAELQELKEVRRPAIVAALAEARSHGDLRENAGYDAAKHDQAMTEKRIADLDALLRQADHHRG